MGGAGGGPDAGPGGDGFAAIDPARGVALDIRTDANRPGSSIRVWDLESGASRDLLNAPSLDELILDPTGSGVAVVAGTAVRYVRFDGGTSTILDAASPVADVTWSADGSYVVVTTDIPDAGLTIVERASGRTVRIPQASSEGELHLVAMAGGIPLPENPLAPEPSPSPSGGGSGPDVAGFPGLLEGWTDASTGRVLVHAERRVPTEDGSLRTVSAMAPIDVGPAPGPEEGDDTTVELIPRPGSSDTLVWITTGEGSAGWLWTGVDPPTRLALPPDWPSTAGDPAWRPDGGALAATAAHPAGDGFEPDFVVAEIGARRTTILPVRDGYDRLEGWWSKAELRVGHGVCFGGCGGEYAESARLRVRDERLVQLGPSDRARAAIDELLFDGGQLVLSTIHDRSSDDLVIDWPPELDGVRLLGAVADARALVLARPSGSSTELYVVDDVVGRARNGRLADPRPRLLATLRGRDDEVLLSPDRAWAIVTDRIGAVSLVRIDDGRAWILDAGRTLEWALP
jgi:hypothetical protein